MIIKVYFRPHNTTCYCFYRFCLKQEKRESCGILCTCKIYYIDVAYITLHGSIQTKLLASCVFCVRSNDRKLNFQFILSTCYAKIKYFIHKYQYCALQQAIFPQTKGNCHAEMYFGMCLYVISCFKDRYRMIHSSYVFCKPCNSKFRMGKLFICLLRV